MVGASHPDRVVTMRNIVAHYLNALKAIDEEAVEAGGTRRGAKTNDKKHA